MVLVFFFARQALSCWPALAQETQQFTSNTPHFATYVRRMFINILMVHSHRYPAGSIITGVDCHISSGHSESVILSGEETDIYLSNGYKKKG
jgi:hypothetical protein